VSERHLRLRHLLFDRSIFAFADQLLFSKSKLLGRSPLGILVPLNATFVNATFAILFAMIFSG
jgi:hypothetical protein